MLKTIRSALPSWTQDSKKKENGLGIFVPYFSLGRVETVENQEKVIEQCRKLAEKFYPTKESIEEEIEKAGARVNVLCMTIDRMTGKLVKES